MLKLLAKMKFNKVWSKIGSFGGADCGNWSEYKALYIEGMILACMLDYRSHHDPQWACLQALEAVMINRERYLLTMPFEYYADLVCALKAKVSQLPQSYKDTAAKLEQVATTLANRNE